MTSAINTVTSSTLDAPDVANNDDDAVINPVVFQCGQCCNLISDTYLLQDIDANGTVWVRSLRPASFDPMLEAYISDDPADDNSVIADVVCALCKKRVGKFYHSTPTHMHAYTRLFALTPSAIQSHQLGAAQQMNSDQTAAHLKLNNIDRLNQVVHILLSHKETLNEQATAIAAVKTEANAEIQTLRNELNDVKRQLSIMQRLFGNHITEAVTTGASAKKRPRPSQPAHNDVGEAVSADKRANGVTFAASSTTPASARIASNSKSQRKPSTSLSPSTRAPSAPPRSSLFGIAQSPMPFGGYVNGSASTIPKMFGNTQRTLAAHR